VTEEEFQARLAAEAAKRKLDPRYCSCAGGPAQNRCPYSGVK
jgi:hypothetical protein